MIQVFESDYIVIGSGIAGLCFALEVAEAGSVTILTKKEDFESSTNYAQGGIAVVSTAEDSFEDHVRDTLIAGAGLCHEDIVRDLVRDGPTLVHQLIDWGVRFTLRDEPASKTGGALPQDFNLYDLGREGGHSKRRILHSKDLTGREVERALLKSLREHRNVRFLEHHIAIDLLVARNGSTPACVGALAMNSEKREIAAFTAPVVLLATGGIGRIYLHTTNPDIATGDGIAIAWRQGLPVVNLEFVQFHPTAYYAEVGNSFLISEAVRGEGAVLKRLNGQAFMNQYDERADLAPRDIVARAIDTELKTHGEPHVLLDCSNMSEEFFADRFPAIRDLCNARGTYPPRDPIPVVPSAHYSCGGVATDRNGQTRMEGLFVTGECAFTGTHGANRLASNSLLEALVFSHRAAQLVLSNSKRKSAPQIEPPEYARNWKRDYTIEGVRIEHCRAELRSLMWDYVGIVRRTDRLELAQDRLSVLSKEIEGYWNEGAIDPDLIELRNMIQTADLIVRCALLRKESRGLHYTLDFPNADESAAVDTCLSWDAQEG
jgi:L-aspartate oxidase